jgi:anti-sigma B factor antagonist
MQLTPFSLTVKQLGRATVIAVRGEMDLATVPDLELAIDAAIERPLLLLVLDLEGVTFMDSTGLACLVRAMSRLEPLDVHLELWPSFDVRRVFELASVPLPTQSYPEPPSRMLAGS